jgi:hypothetical protein
VALANVFERILPYGRKKDLFGDSNARFARFQALGSDSEGWLMKTRTTGILWMDVTRCLAAAAIMGLVSSAAQAAPIIYEPFAQATGTIGGKAGGTGLNSWTTSGTTVNVVDPPTLSYGDLDNTGGQANVVNNAGIWAAVTTTTALADAGLLDDGATLWFSYVFQKTANGGSNEHSGFAFATQRVNPAFNGLNLNAAGEGFGVYTNSSNVVASSWSNTTSRVGGGSSALQSLGNATLVIGKIEWGATSGDNETLTVYTRALDDIATEPTTGGGVRTVAGFDQTLLNTISFGQRNSGGTQFYDEIRFGATYADVAPIAVPEPSVLAFLAAGSIAAVAALRRRRKAA